MEAVSLRPNFYTAILHRESHHVCKEWLLNVKEHISFLYIYSTSASGHMYAVFIHSRKQPEPGVLCDEFKHKVQATLCWTLHP